LGILRGLFCILFGQEGIIILRGGGRGEPRQRVAIIPGHPLRGTSLQLLSLPLQLGQIIERIGSVQLAGVDQTHEQIADSGAVHRLVEERVLAVQDGFLQGTLDDVIVDWRVRLLQKQRQLRPVIQEVEMALPSPEFGSVLWSASCASSHWCSSVINGPLCF